MINTPLRFDLSGKNNYVISYVFPAGKSKNMYCLYILQCADKTLYTGITTDLKRRIIEHNNKKLGSKYTSARRPVKIVYLKKFKNRSAASKAEAQIKKLKKTEKLELIGKLDRS